jgi:hypothetical protein
LDVSAYDETIEREGEKKKKKRNKL